jgi:hypothetical protein
VYAAPVDNEGALHHRIVDAFQTIRNYPGIFARMGQSVMRRVEACIESSGGHFERILSTITHKLNVSGHVLTWIFFLVLPKVCQHLSVTLAYHLVVKPYIYPIGQCVHIKCSRRKYLPYNLLVLHKFAFT